MKDHILYDSITLGASAVTATLFQEAVGAKTNGYYDTNMEQDGRLASPMSFTVKALSIGFKPDAVIADLQAVFAGWFKFRLNDVDMIGPLPLFMLPQAGGIHAMPDSGSTGTTVLAIGAGAGVKNVFVLDRPITIAPNTGFKMEFTWPAAPNAKTFWIFLHGDLSE